MEASLDERTGDFVFVGNVSELARVSNDKRKGEDAAKRGGISGGNTFVVESEIEILDETKVNFTFLSAGLKFSNGFTLPVPPVGKGWFENIYVGERYRVARDSRGDTLIVERC